MVRTYTFWIVTIKEKTIQDLAYCIKRGDLELAGIASSSYVSALSSLGEDEKELKKKIIKFREDELHHKDIAYENGASKDGLYSILDKAIKTGSRIAITISEKI